VNGGFSESAEQAEIPRGNLTPAIVRRRFPTGTFTLLFCFKASKEKILSKRNGNQTPQKFEANGKGCLNHQSTQGAIAVLRLRTWRK
jgi:hypothetical protein